MLGELGAAPNLVRQDFPYEPDIYPFPLNLEPLSRATLAKYVYTEAPADTLDRDDPANADPATQAFLDQLDAALGGVEPNHLGSLYQTIIDRTTRLIDAAVPGLPDLSAWPAACSPSRTRAKATRGTSGFFRRRLPRHAPRDSAATPIRGPCRQTTPTTPPSTSARTPARWTATPTRSRPTADATPRLAQRPALLDHPRAARPRLPLRAPGRQRTRKTAHDRRPRPLGIAPRDPRRRPTVRPAERRIRTRPRHRRPPCACCGPSCTRRRRVTDEVHDVLPAGFPTHPEHPDAGRARRDRHRKPAAARRDGGGGGGGTPRRPGGERLLVHLRRPLPVQPTPAGARRLRCPRRPRRPADPVRRDPGRRDVPRRLPHRGRTAARRLQRCPPSSSASSTGSTPTTTTALQVAFEHFGYGDLFDDRRPPGNKVHMMDSSGPANPPIGYHRWHAIIRAMTMLGIDADRWNAIDRLVALAWAIHAEAQPTQDADNPPLPTNASSRSGPAGSPAPPTSSTPPSTPSRSRRLPSEAPRGAGRRAAHRLPHLLPDRGSRGVSWLSSPPPLSAAVAVGLLVGHALLPVPPASSWSRSAGSWGSPVVRLALAGRVGGTMLGFAAHALAPDEPSGGITRRSCWRRLGNADRAGEHWPIWTGSTSDRSTSCLCTSGKYARNGTVHARAARPSGTFSPSCRSHLRTGTRSAVRTLGPRPVRSSPRAADRRGRSTPGCGVGRRQHHRRRHARLVGLRPPARAQAPAITRSQPREAELRAWSHQVVAHLRAEPQELLGDHRAHRVHPGVLAPGVTAAVTVEARHRVGAAALQLATQHVARHRRIVPSATDTSSATSRGSNVSTRVYATRSRRRGPSGLPVIADTVPGTALAPGGRPARWAPTRASD